MPDHHAVPAVEDGDVLGHRDLVGGLVERFQVGVDGAAVGVAKLRARYVEVRSHLDEREHASLEPGHPVTRRRRHRARAAQVGRRVRPAVRSGEVDQLAAGERRGEALRVPRRRAASSPRR